MLHKKLFIFFFVLFATSLVIADELRHHQKVDGMDIYLDVLPVQATQKDGNNYHIVITLVDSKSGKRITNAGVKASVEPLGKEEHTKDLDPMHGELISYGNYFTMHKAVHYNVKVEIQRANKEPKSVAMFIFKQAQEQ